MKLYINGTSSYRSDLEDCDVRNELKSIYKHDIRRKDAFIHLALLGAFRLRDTCEVEDTDELYLTSGVGNTEALKSMILFSRQAGGVIKPFDFINLLGNTASYHVARVLGLTGKALFQVSNHFTYLNTLISAYASIRRSGHQAIIASCDLKTDQAITLQRVLGVDTDTRIESSVNYQRVSLQKQQNSLAEIEFDMATFDQQEVEAYIENVDGNLLSSVRCAIATVEREPVFFETITSFMINNAIRKRQDHILIDSCADRYKICKLTCY